ncbi:MAG: metallophosphoesterase [Clostridia bacterium]|nr:metallophosphoesterase [Clostridia bacterium]
MALYTLADVHLSFGTDKPMDVFGGRWVHYEQKLKEYWEYLVRPEDTVVIPGDISWGMNLEEAAPDLAFLHALPGRKILMKGNHDLWWSSLAKLEHLKEEKQLESLTFLQNSALYAEGKVICGSRGWMCEDSMTAADEKVLRREGLRFEMSLNAAEKLADKTEAETGVRPEIICFSHYPVVTPAQRENPILSVLVEHKIKRVYFGHLHNWDGKPLIEEWAGIHFTLVSADAVLFIPVRID